MLKFKIMEGRFRDYVRLQSPIRRQLNVSPLVQDCLKENKLNWKKLRKHSFRENNFFGLEIEAENISAKTLDYVSAFMLDWTAISDGSLKKAGKEFVSVPMQGKDIYNQLYSLWTIFSLSSPPSFKWRSSTHVHMNASHFSFEEFSKFLLLYCIFENSLFEFAGNHRKKSVFCVPMLETSISQFFHKCLIETAEPFSLLKSNDKYCALNLQHLGNGVNSKCFGTVEFRHFPGAQDPEKVYEWICILDELMASTYKLSLDKITDAVLSLNTSSQYFQFLTEVFPQTCDLLNSPSLKEQMEEGIKYCKLLLSPVTLTKRSFTLKNCPALKWVKQNLYHSEQPDFNLDKGLPQGKIKANEVHF